MIHQTGVWRRGANGDYECTEQELEPILLAKSGISYEQTVLADATWEDLDPAIIALYRQLRSKIKPHAEELLVSDEEMLHSMRVIKNKQEVWVPTIAGLLLFGKTLSLRRLLPAMRVDYVRISGTQWLDNPEQRFTATMDMREPLIRLIPKLEAAILDDMPWNFRLEEGQTQRSDTPLLPHKVVREAVVNSLMHRDYRVNQPIIIARYSNRLEILNPGYSLKPEDEFNSMGSRQRNPAIAAVLYDLNFAETKGSGIRTMKRLLNEIGFSAPIFKSNLSANQFSSNFLLHQLMDERHLKWLLQFSHLNLSNDEAKALILAKEVGAIDNGALRDITDLDTLAASHVLGNLHKKHKLFEKGGKGPATYYCLKTEHLDSNTSDLSLNTSDLSSNTSDLGSNTSDLGSNTSDLGSNMNDQLPAEFEQTILKLSSKARKDELWPIILSLLAIKPCTANHIALFLRRKVTPLKTNHLNKMRQEGLIDYLYHVVNHPDQAYKITQKGLASLKIQSVREIIAEANTENIRDQQD